VLDGGPAPPKKWQSTLHFSTHVYFGLKVAHLS